MTAVLVKLRPAFETKPLDQPLPAAASAQEVSAEPGSSSSSAAPSSAGNGEEAGGSGGGGKKRPVDQVEDASTPGEVDKKMKLDGKGDDDTDAAAGAATTVEGKEVAEEDTKETQPVA